MLVFVEGGKPEFPEKNSRSREENQQTPPTYDARSGNRTRDVLVEGEHSHHCANPAPHAPSCSLMLNILVPRFCMTIKSPVSSLPDNLLRFIPIGKSVQIVNFALTYFFFIFQDKSMFLESVILNTTLVKIALLCSRR